MCAAGEDPRIVFAYEAPWDTEGVGEFLYVTADCRYFVRPRAEDWNWTPVHAGVLDEAELAALNEGLLELPWPALANTDTVGPHTDDYRHIVLRRGSLLHYCNDGCPELRPLAEEAMDRLYEVGGTLTTPLLASATPGRDELEPIDVVLTVSPAALERGVLLDGSDAAALRDVVAVARMGPPLPPFSGMSIRLGGVLYRVWFRETLPIESPIGTLPDPLEPGS